MMTPMHDMTSTQVPSTSRVRGSVGSTTGAAGSTALAAAHRGVTTAPVCTRGYWTAGATLANATPFTNGNAFVIKTHSQRERRT